MSDFDKTGCFIGTDGMWIETFSGHALHLNGDCLDQIRIVDIAHALSNTCRYAGHCQRFYSVAEHSIHVHDMLARRNLPLPESSLKAALLHDASEAYLGDVTRPLKAMLPEYREIERRMMAAIRLAFALTDDEYSWQEIKRADNAVLMAEAKVLMRSGGKLWDFGGNVEPAQVELKCWTPTVANERFLDLWRRYERPTP